MILLSLMFASAADLEVEVNAEAGSLHVGDPAYDLFSNGNALPSFGLSTAIRPAMDRHFPVALVASWHHNSRGSRVDSYPNERRFTAAFTTETFSLGPKLDVDIGEVFAPYVTVQGVLMRGLARFDDAPNDPESPGQTRYAGSGGGVLAMGGIEFSSPDIRGFPAEFLWHLEIGYGAMSAIGLGDLGSVQPGGIAVRTGMGVRFGRSGRKALRD